MTATRVDIHQTAPSAYRALISVEADLKTRTLEPILIELVKFRASQINGCAFCLDMHAHDARRAGETEQRLFVLAGWRECALFSDRERAALAWCEHLTQIATDGAPDAAYDALRPHFSDTEIGDLTLLTGMINLWNRVAIGTAMHPPVRR